jgi:phosphinothricin acetyltransferase
MGSGKLTIIARPAVAPDFGRVSSIFAWYAVNTIATFEDAPRAETDWQALRSDLDARRLPFLVADADGEIVGYAYAAPWRRKSAYAATVEDSVFVAPEHTGRGIGRILLTSLMSAAFAAGARQMIAVIADSDADASVGLHRACGFRHAGRLTSVGYKQGRWIDTVLMQRDLSGEGAASQSSG